MAIAASPSSVAVTSSSFYEGLGQATCRYYARTTGSVCAEPRTCRDCLNTEGCMINEMGLCVSQLEEPLVYDFLVAIEKNRSVTRPLNSSLPADTIQIQRWQFPADKATYCPVDDRVCAECRRNRFFVQVPNTIDSRFCVGDKGCICVLSCELSRATPACVTAIPSSNIPTPHPDRLSRPVATRYFFVAASSAFLVLFILFLNSRRLEVAARRIRREIQRRGPMTRAQLDPSPPGVGTITLSGWRRYHRDLIDKEHRSYGGENDDVTDTVSTSNNIQSVAPYIVMPNSASRTPS